jgi:tetratricopeptide (TPR) repeat protein
MAVEPNTDPFPGLRPFEASEGHLFFGREGQSEETLRRLRLHRFLAMVGSSGSGKSSLVRAGLLPYLYGGFLSGAGSHWRVALFRPGSDPIGNLARALNDPAVIGKPGEDPAAAAQSGVLIEVSLRRSGLGLIEAARLAGLPEHEQLLIVIDQFEELFRFAGAIDKPRHDNDAAAFVKLLLEASGQREVPIYVALTMRSDFIGDCARYRGLPEAVTTGLYLIPRMTREERRTAIVEPVRVGGGSIAPRLVNRLLNDGGDDPDQLPILQHALMRTWDYWKTHGGERRPIDVEDYLAIGGMADALSQHADEAYDSLPDERHRAIARRVFQALSEKGADHRETRRPTTVGTLAEVADAPVADIIRVLEEFRRPGRSFVTPAAGVALDASSVIDISHESLIRGWHRLRRWVEEEMESATVYRRLAETAELHARGMAGLWHDPDLQHALAWREKEHPTADWAKRYHPGFEPAVAFLEQSRAARDLEQRMRTQTRRLALGVSTAASVAMAALALFSWSKYLEADRHKLESDRHLVEAQQERERTEQALAALTPIADTVVFDLIQSVRLAGLPIDAAESLDRAIQAYDRAIQLHPTAFAFTGRGMAYWLKHDFGRVIEDTSAAIRLDPGYVRAHNVRGMAYNDLHDNEHALADFNEAIRLDPNYARAYSNRGTVYNSNKDYARAIAEFSRAIELEPTNWAMRRNRGNAYTDIQEYDLAIRDFTEAIRLNPNFALAYNSRGWAFYKKGDYDRAVENYTEAIKIDPKYALAYNNRGWAFYNKGDYDRAVENYTEAIKIDPKNALAYNNRGLVFYHKRDYEQAMRDFDIAIAADPTNKYPHYNEGNIYRDQGDLDHAIAEYSKAIAVAPDYAEAYGRRGGAYLSAGDPRRALNDFEYRVHLEPKNANAYVERAIAEIYAAKSAAAVEDLRTALRLQPTGHYALLWLHIAQLRADQRNDEEVRDAAEKLDRTTWPWPVIELLLGSSSPEAARARAQSADNAATRQERECEADFYIGVELRENGGRDEARRLFEEAVDICPKGFWEYMAAKNETRRPD